MTGLKKRWALLTNDLTPHQIAALHINKQDEIPITTQADLLGISRSSVYYQPAPPNPEDLILKHKIDEIYTELPFYGVIKMTEELKRRNYEIGVKRTRRLMREMGLEAIYPKPNTSKNNNLHPKYPYLLKGVKLTHPNQIWGTDITYIRLLNGFVYLVAFMDWYSRYVVAWALSITLATDFVIKAAKDALNLAIPEIINSDQGVQFTSVEYLDTWDKEKTKISMDGRGRYMDNIFTERLWRSVKQDDIYPKAYDCVTDVRDGLDDYFNKYNYRRLHQSLNYKTPAEIYFK